MLIYVNEQEHCHTSNVKTVGFNTDLRDDDDCDYCCYYCFCYYYYYYYHQVDLIIWDRGYFFQMSSQSIVLAASSILVLYLSRIYAV